MLDGAGAAGGARVRGRLVHGGTAADAVVPFADAFARHDAEEETARRIDVVIFEVETLQPRIVPRQIFRFDERVEQPLLRDPIDAADEFMSILLERFESETPA